MEITEVRISPARGGKVRAFASIVLDDCFIINDLRVMEGREGQLYVTMPSRKTRNGQLRDIAHPLNSETRTMVEERVLREFQAAVENLVIPERSTGGGGGQRGQEKPMARLATKLLADDFWTGESGGRSDDGRR
ncbi:MAG: septation protein spoVG [Acidobacteria bacterium]|nr:septation protein spoVG [Acidobacteriota bacterium]